MSSQIQSLKLSKFPLEIYYPLSVLWLIKTLPLSLVALNVVALNRAVIKNQKDLCECIRIPIFVYICRRDVYKIPIFVYIELWDVYKIPDFPWAVGQMQIKMGHYQQQRSTRSSQNICKNLRISFLSSAFSERRALLTWVELCCINLSHSSRDLLSSFFLLSI